MRHTQTDPAKSTGSGETGAGAGWGTKEAKQMALTKEEYEQLKSVVTSAHTRADERFREAVKNGWARMAELWAERKHDAEQAFHVVYRNRPEGA